MNHTPKLTADQWRQLATDYMNALSDLRSAAHAPERCTIDPLYIELMRKRGLIDDAAGTDSTPQEIE